MNDREERAQSSISFLLLRIGQRRYLLAGSAVKQLVAASRVQSAGDSPHGPSGPAVDSETVRVVDLRLLDGHAAGLTDERVVILVQSGNELLGLIVHEVERILSFSLDAVAEPPDVDECWRDLVVGSVRQQEQTLLVIDHDRLFSMIKERYLSHSV